MKGKFRGKLSAPSKNKSPGISGKDSDLNRETDSNPPEFSLRYLQKGFCVDACELKEKAALADKLFRLSQLSWAQIRQQDRHKLGYEKIARNAIRSGIPAHITEDVDLIAFRFCGLAPMVGYKYGATFYILWLDRAFTLYQH